MTKSTIQRGNILSFRALLYVPSCSNNVRNACAARESDKDVAQFPSKAMQQRRRIEILSNEATAGEEEKEGIFLSVRACIENSLARRQPALFRRRGMVASTYIWGKSTK